MENTNNSWQCRECSSEGWIVRHKEEFCPITKIPRKDAEILSYSNLIPAELDNELIQIGESTTEGMFRIGEIANYIADQTPDTKKEFIYSAVGSRCGKGKRTVREFADIEKFFHDAWRSYEVLSFDHFRQAYKHRKTNWQEMLDWAVVHESGRPQTVDAMIKEFAQKKEQEDPIQKIVRRFDNLIDDMMIVVSPTTSVKIWNKAQEILELIKGKEEEVV
jgi:hypothetical protein